MLNRKKSDWLTKKGCKNRAKGLKEKESRVRKCGYFLLFLVSFFIFLALGIMHADLFGNAMKINTNFADTPGLKEGVAPYDMCSIPSFTPDPELSAEEVA